MFAEEKPTVYGHKGKISQECQVVRGGGGLNLLSQFPEFEVGGDKFYSKHFLRTI